MAAAAHAGGSKGMYSWWWDSHMSPKNSKWLQENLTDMDTKVQQMIKLIEEDADSFARRAEMYYKKRPELMKLVEEFYRAYRALAERYNHATGVIRHAHRTMSEAFPNQMPMMFDGDPPSGSYAEADFRTPPPTHALTEDVDSTSIRKGVKQLNNLFGSAEGGNLSEGRVRKGLKFHDAAQKEHSGHKGESNGKDRNISAAEQVSRTEAEILTLKKALAELETEKQAGLVQYQQSLEKLSILESEVSHAQEDSRILNERASKAESEVETMKEALAKLEAEKEASLLQYEQCLDKLSSLEMEISLVQKDAEGRIDEEANKARLEIEALRQDLVRVKTEKEAAIVQHKQCLEKISVLEEQLKYAKENVRMANDRADKSEAEIESLKQEIKKLIEEKEHFARQYQECLETVSCLELKLTCAEEEAKRLNSEIEDGVAKLKGTEEKCLLVEKSNQTLHSELESMVLKMGAQSQELTEKQKELGRLWTCIQEERMRFVEAETAFQTLQHLHSQSQEELRSVAAELQTRSQLLRDMESRSQGLHEEIQNVKEENRSLNDLNHSSVLTVKDLRDEISSLRDTIGKLETEVELRVDQRNALQQEIYCLKEELNDVNKKNQNIVEQLESVNLNPDCFGLSVKNLQDENTTMKEKSEKDRTEKLALLEKLEVLEKLTEKNSFMENSISDLNVELEGVRAKVKELEESCQSLLLEKSVLVSEKATLISQLNITSENLDTLSEKNKILENSLFDINAEVDILRVRSKSLEESCLLLNSEKSGLVAEREDLVSQLNIAQKALEDLEGRCAKVNEKCKALEEERNSTLQRLGDLQNSLDAEKEEHARFSQLSKSQLASLELQIHLLQEEGERRNKEYDEELDNAISAEIQIFILHNYVQDLKEKNSSLQIEGKKLLGKSKLLARMNSKLENENAKQQHDVKSLSDQIAILRLGLYQVSVAVSSNMKQDYVEMAEGDKNLLNCIIKKVKVMQNDISKSLEENQKFIIDNLVLSTILDQFGVEAANVLAERDGLSQKSMIQSEHLSALQEGIQKLERMNEQLRLEKMEEGQKKEALVIEVDNLSAQLSDLKGACQHSQEQNSQLTAEKRYLAEKVSVLEQENHSIQEENCGMFGDQVYLMNFSLILKAVISEKFQELKEFNRRLESLKLVNGGLMEKLRLLEGQMEESKLGNEHLKALVEKLENELNSVKSLNNQLNCDIANEKNQKSQKENELLRAQDQIKVMQTDMEEMKGLFEEHTEIVGELQTSAVQETLFKEKFYELAKACNSLEAGNGVKSAEIDLLKKRISNLESENGGYSSQLAAFIPVVISLRECVASLERHTVHRKILNESDKTEIKVSDLASHGCTDDSKQKSEFPNTTVICSTLELQDLQSRLKAVEMSLLEKEKLSLQEVSDANNKLEAMTREIEDLKSERKLSASGKKEKAAYMHSSDVKLQEHLPGTTETGNGVLPKDIMLDQNSDCSSFGKSRRKNMETVPQLIEYCDTSDHDGNDDLRVGNVSSRFHQDEAGKKHKNRHSSSEFTVYKELSVDRIESKRYSEPNQEGNKRKILERLDSDAQKLTNLQITVQDLKRKVGITEKGKNVLEFDYDGVKGQLEEADDGIKKLVDVNHKLIKNIEAGSTAAEGKSTVELNRDRSIRRRRISEQARRASEKIGRLQVEVQKIQFLLLKHDGEKESRGKVRVGGRSKRVLLRDYLYGGSKTGQRKKKAPFCSCVQPPTSGD